MDDCFYSVTQTACSRLKIRRSEFICTLEPVASVEAARAFISRVSKEYRNATHNCWAYILGVRAEKFHCSDAGEPSGTAGRPMLNALKAGRMTDIAAVVTRYFGGVRLGVRGLMDAYALSVSQTLKAAVLKAQVPHCVLVIRLGYEINDAVLSHLKMLEAGILESVYADRVVHRVEVREERLPRLMAVLGEYRHAGRLEVRDASGGGL